MIRARTVDEASQALEGAPRSGAHVYWVADDATYGNTRQTPTLMHFAGLMIKPFVIQITAYEQYRAAGGARQRVVRRD